MTLALPAPVAPRKAPGPSTVRVDELRVVRATVPRLVESDPSVAVWRDRRGEAAAYGLTAGAWRWLVVVGVGAYRFRSEPRDLYRVEVEVVPEEGVAAEVLDDYFLRTVMPVAVQPHGLEAVHASAVAFDGFGAALFCADSNSGKSTLAYVLGQRGARHLADDFVLHDPTTARALPVPFVPRLRRPSAERFGAPRRSEVAATSVGWSRRLDERLPLGAIFLLNRGADRIHIEPAPSSYALGRLLNEAFVDAISDRARKRSLVEAYLRLTASVPVFRLSYPDGLGDLPAVCERIESFASHRAAAARC